MNIIQHFFLGFMAVATILLFLLWVALSAFAVFHTGHMQTWMWVYVGIGFFIVCTLIGARVDDAY